MRNEDKPLLIIDGYGFVFRAYHVQPPLTSPAGFPVGAIYGLTSMLIKLISDFKPEKAVMVLDHGGKNFRHQIYDKYKANRPPAPEDLVAQLQMVRQAAAALNFKILEQKGFEADDIIATLAKEARNKKQEVVIISADKDLMQLMSDHVRLYDPTKSKYISAEDVVAKFGVGPEQVREVQALMGDKSDNIPGVNGFGPKTAADLILKFHDLHNLIENIDKIPNNRQRDLLSNHREDALISWQLVGLDSNVSLDIAIEELVWQAPEAQKISDFLVQCGFKSLYKRIQNLFNIKIEENYANLVRTASNLDNDYEIIQITDSENFDNFVAEVQNVGVISCNLIEQEEGAKKIAFSLPGKLNRIFLISYQQKKKHNNHHANDLFSYARNVDSYSNTDKLSSAIEKIFADPAILKIGFGLKKWLKSFEVKSFDDLELMDYCLSAGKKAKMIGEIIVHYSGLERELLFTDNIALGLHFFNCHNQLKEELVKNKVLYLYDSIDLPICYILHNMEEAGVSVDLSKLRDLSQEFTEKLILLEKEIFAITGKEFNLSSPKQLGEILFVELKLPFGKLSSKSKTYSTGSDILEKLSEAGFKIADLLLEYRHLSKLKNTYTDSLPCQINKVTGRIHTTFLQNSTSTGRLSSKDPNVQNIPIRTDIGKKIRSAFVSKSGYKLISADYSQIELRILSHVANVPSLKAAFMEGKDIHSQTASQIFGLKLEEVTPDLRYKAKAINFGIIYGISSFGLAKQLNITGKEAANYIERYFTEYPEIKFYMKETIEFAKAHGYVENLLGRKCFLPTINDKNHALRSFAERAAINAPMQSLAADIVKLAMIDVETMLRKRGFTTKMIMQIHDELIFESPDSEVDQVLPLIKDAMQRSFMLDVPTIVDIGFGNNWQDL